jgi:hypothetical protein
MLVSWKFIVAFLERKFFEINQIFELCNALSRFVPWCVRFRIGDKAAPLFIQSLPYCEKTRLCSAWGTLRYEALLEACRCRIDGRTLSYVDRSGCGRGALTLVAYYLYCQLRPKLRPPSSHQEELKRSNEIFSRQEWWATITSHSKEPE